MSFGPALQKMSRATPEKISAAIIITKGGTARIWIGISKPLWQRLQRPQNCDVNIGLAEDVVKLRLVFKRDGAYRIFKLGGGAGRLILPLIDGVPEGYAFGAVSCDFVSTQTHLVLTLPLAAWNAAIQAERKVA